MSRKDKVLVKNKEIIRDRKDSPRGNLIWQLSPRKSKRKISISNNRSEL